MHKIKSGLILFFLIVSPFVLPAQPDLNPYQFKPVKKITCTNGAVVSAHALASAVGVNILKQGGNAVDAAVATQLALAVVYPGAGNIGGGGFTIIHLKNGKNISVDYRETAPAKAFRDMYLDANGNPQMNLSQDGHLAVGVPGSVAGIFECMKYANLPFKKLILKFLGILFLFACLFFLVSAAAVKTKLLIAIPFTGIIILAGILPYLKFFLKKK